MNILLNINHPAHVHLFRNAIRLWQEHGHAIEVIARDKDITLALLEHYQIPYRVGSLRRAGLAAQGFELLSHTAQIVRQARRFKPDLMLSVASPMASFASFLTGAPHLVFDDTEHARLQGSIYRPFARLIFTPACFRSDLGPKQRRYAGYHELAYLHPNHYRPDPLVLQGLGLEVNKPFSVVRLVSWQAAHDIGQHGFSSAERDRLLALLSAHGQVVLSNENQKEPVLLGRDVSIPAAEIHNLLAYATLYIGEGGTMATEAALLGTPSIFVSTLSGGNWDELENKYQLMYSFTNPAAAIDKTQELLQDADLKKTWAARRQRMLAEKIDLTAWMVELVENYPR